MRFFGVFLPSKQFTLYAFLKIILFFFWKNPGLPPLLEILSIGSIRIKSFSAICNDKQNNEIKAKVVLPVSSNLQHICSIWVNIKLFQYSSFAVQCRKCCRTPIYAKTKLWFFFILLQNIFNQLKVICRTLKNILLWGFRVVNFYTFNNNNKNWLYNF